MIRGSLCRKLFRALADLLAPRKCIVCGEKLTLAEEHMCRWCRDDMPLTRFWQIRHNRMADKMNERIQAELERALVDLERRQTQSDGRPSDDSTMTDTDRSSPCPPLERYAYAAALFFFNEEGDYKKIPYRIKYEGDIRAGKHFGMLLGEHMLSAEWFRDIDVLIPVPLHWKRRWKRGYNQAEIIAEGISGALGVPVRTDILKRRRNTRTQIHLDIEGKAANVAGAFIATRTIDDNPTRHILLVDDVFTTGSTLTACFTALRAVFPSGVRISVATLAFVGEV